MRVASKFLAALLAAVLASCGGHGAAFAPSLTRAQSRSAGPDASSPYAVVHLFAGGKNGAEPAGALLVASGAVYATTVLGGSNVSNCSYMCGTVVSMATTGSKFKVLYKFGGNNDGTSPTAGVVMDKAGALYGSSLAGLYNYGIVYKLAPGKGSWKKTTLHTFTGSADMDSPSALILDENTSTLYGTAAGHTNTDCCGTVFSIHTDGTGYKILHTFTPGTVGHNSTEGGNPSGALVEDASGALYGSTLLGGAATAQCSGGCGTIFKLTPRGKRFAFSVVYAFRGAADGSSPQSPLALSPVKQNGQTVLYGAASGGGAVQCLGSFGTTVGCGTVFAITSAGTLTPLYQFQGQLNEDGQIPESGVTLVGSMLYGVIRVGGPHDSLGMLYRVSTLNKQYTVLHEFHGGVDGESPYGQPAYAKHVLYGSTSYGGTCSTGGDGGCGTIFRYKI